MNKSCLCKENTRECNSKILKITNKNEQSTATKFSSKDDNILIDIIKSSQFWNENGNTDELESIHPTTNNEAIGPNSDARYNTSKVEVDLKQNLQPNIINKVYETERKSSIAESQQKQQLPRNTNINNTKSTKSQQKQQPRKLTKSENSVYNQIQQNEIKDEFDFTETKSVIAEILKNIESGKIAINESKMKSSNMVSHLKQQPSTKINIKKVETKLINSKSKHDQQSDNITKINDSGKKSANVKLNQKKLDDGGALIEKPKLNKDSINKRFNGFIGLCKPYNIHICRKQEGDCRYLHLCEGFVRTLGRCKEECRYNHDIREPSCLLNLERAEISVNQPLKDILKKIFIHIDILYCRY